jgi:hypothetical protein
LGKPNPLVPTPSINLLSSCPVEQVSSFFISFNVNITDYESKHLPIPGTLFLRRAAKTEQR